MNRKPLELWVGLFMAAGLLALAMLAFKVGNLATADVLDAYTVKARFDNIGSLKVRAPVKSSGVVVGRVDDIQFDGKKFVARVTMNLDKRYEFPKDTSVSILTSGLLGEQYIGLDAGGDERYLKDGDEVMLTQSAIVLEKMIGQFLFSKASETPNNKK